MSNYNLFTNPSIRVQWFTVINYINSLNFCVCRHFRGMNFTTLNGTMSRHLQTLLKAEIPENQKYWKEEGLFDFSFSVLFKYERVFLFPRTCSWLCQKKHVKLLAKLFKYLSVLCCFICKHSKELCRMTPLFHTNVWGHLSGSNSFWRQNVSVFSSSCDMRNH